MSRLGVFMSVGVFVLFAAPVFGQSGRGMVEGGGGYAQFVDESPIDHAVVHGGARVCLTSRLAVGPEVTFMRGPGEDRDLFLAANVTMDLAAPTTPRRVTPYIVGAVGLLRHTSTVGVGTFTARAFAFSGGGGARVSVGDRWFLAPEFRLGSELHWRATGAIGVKF